MKSLTIKDLSKTEELDHEAMAAVHGGMKCLVHYTKEQLDRLSKGPDGDPVDVYVNGALVNSVTTGYAPK
ncbi:MAG: hypothetical protein JWN13_320 [Betaproteobacteria bacterium]|jgi:hypothetical protein|nr:hypothetical protein [Betaproteobacteria bacterium]